MMESDHETPEDAVTRRIQTYGCDGRCYDTDHMCGAVDICDETRKGERIAIAVALLIIMLVVIASIVLLGVGIILNIKYILGGQTNDN